MHAARFHLRKVSEQGGEHSIRLPHQTTSVSKQLVVRDLIERAAYRSRRSRSIAIHISNITPRFFRYACAR